MVDPLSTRDLIKRLGTFLADLTEDRPATRIHAEILERLRDTWQEPDPQLSGIYFDDKDFSSVWTAIRNGASLPINSWDTVVLPAIVYYSGKESLKPNLETAIHLWGQARSSLSNVLEAAPQQPIVPVYEVLREDTLDTLSLPSSPAIAPERPIAPRVRRTRGRKRWLVGTVASVLVALAAGGVVAYDNATREPAAGKVPAEAPTQLPASVRPIESPAPSAEPTSTPSAGPTPEASMVPVAPTSVPPGVVAPTPPRALVALGKTHQSVSLSWQPPTDAGTRGLSHYRVFKGMAEIGTATGTSFTVTGLAPKTGYTFSVLAVNRAGANSPASNPVSVTTADPPVVPPPPPPAPRVTVDPSSPIAYGMAFSVVGDHWPCTAPAQVEVYMRDQLIAKPNTDSNGHFDVFIEVVIDLPNAKVPLYGMVEEYLYLYYDQPETIRVELTSHPQCSSTAVQSTQVTFVSPEV